MSVFLQTLVEVTRRTAHSENFIFMNVFTYVYPLLKKKKKSKKLLIRLYRINTSKRSFQFVNYHYLKRKTLRFI